MAVGGARWLVRLTRLAPPGRRCWAWRVRARSSDGKVGIRYSTSPVYDPDSRAASDHDACAVAEHGGRANPTDMRSVSGSSSDGGGAGTVYVYGSAQVLRSPLSALTRTLLGCVVGGARSAKHL